MHCDRKGITWLKVIPIDTAVSCESPVIIFTATPELISVASASFTPTLGGSMMATSPRKVRAPISDPEANASTARGQDNIISCCQNLLNLNIITVYSIKCN